MLIVDAQVHIWSSGTPTNANHRQVAAFTKDDLLKEMDEAGVDAAVHPSAGVLGSELQRAGRRGGAPASRPPRDPRQLPARQAREPRADRRLEEAARDARAALRRSCSRTEELADRRHDRLAVAGGRARRAADRAARPATSCPSVGQVAEQHPGLKLIIDHLGAALAAPRTTRRWANLPAMLALAKLPERGDQGHRRAELLAARPIPTATSTAI